MISASRSVHSTLVTGNRAALTRTHCIHSALVQSFNTATSLKPQAALRQAPCASQHRRSRCFRAAAPAMSSTAPGGGQDSKPPSTSTNYNWQDTCIAASGAGAAQFAPAADSNKGPILAVLARHLPAAPGPGLVLEVASGTGQHVAHFAAALPHLTWQPSDVTADLFGSVAAHCRGVGGVLAPLVLDASWAPDKWAAALGGSGGDAGGAAAGDQPGGKQRQRGRFDGVVVANMTHISPWAATEGLVAGAAAVLRRGGVLSVYGPFKLRGAFTTESNLAFHQRLVARWGGGAVDVMMGAGCSGLLKSCVGWPH
jgi:hypothetical protein